MALDDKGKRLHGRLDFFDRNITQFTKHMKQIVGHHRDGVAQGMEFSSNIKNIAAQEPFADLQDRLVGLAGIMENIALERKSVMCDRATIQVLDKLAQIKTSVVAPMQVLLRDRDECVKALLKAEDKVADEQTKGVSEEMSMATLERRQMLMNAEATVDNNFELFEAQRIEDLKEILEEFLRGEMYYHCRALEMLGPALGHFSDVNTEAAQENMRKDIDGMNKQLRYN